MLSFLLDGYFRENILCFRYFQLMCFAESTDIHTCLHTTAPLMYPYIHACIPLLLSCFHTYVPAFHCSSHVAIHTCLHSTAPLVFIHICLHSTAPFIYMPASHCSYHVYASIPLLLLFIHTYMPAINGSCHVSIHTQLHSTSLLMTAFLCSSHVSIHTCLPSTAPLMYPNIQDRISLLLPCIHG